MTAEQVTQPAEYALPCEEPADGTILRAYDGLLVIERDDAASKGTYPPAARWWIANVDSDADAGPWTWADACVRWPQLLDDEKTVRLYRADDPAIAVLVDDDLPVRVQAGHEGSVRVALSGYGLALKADEAEAFAGALIRAARKAREVSQ